VPRLRRGHPPDRRRLPGVTSRLLAESVAELMALPEGNVYRAVAEGKYRPRLALDGERWERTVPLLLQILAADPRRTSDAPRLLDTRRSALSRHLYWLAGEHPDELNPDFALDDIQVVRSALNSEGHTTQRSQTSCTSQLRSFRAGFPDLFPVCRRKQNGGGTCPFSERDFATAWQGAFTFWSRDTCRSIQAMLLLARGAGADGRDIRHVAGTDVVRKPGSGLWVRIKTGKGQRDVPVLARFQSDLEQLALEVGDGPLIGGGLLPTAYGRPNELTDMLKRRLRLTHPWFEVSCSRLRKAWLLEQMSSWPELQIFLRAAGLKSMHGLEDLLARCPEVPSDPHREAVALGGIKISAPGQVGGGAG